MFQPHLPLSPQRLRRDPTLRTSAVGSHARMAKLPDTTPSPSIHRDTDCRSQLQYFSVHTAHRWTMQPPSLTSHHHAPAMINQLRDNRSSDELLNDIFLDIAFHLTSAIDHTDIPTPEGLHSLIATLRDNLVQVTHTPGGREIDVCNRSLVFVTHTAHISPAYRWQARGRFAGETAIAPPRGAGEAEKQIAPWLNHTGTHWQIMILDWLARYLTPWLAQADIPSPEKQARKLASQATQSIISNT